MLMAHIVAQAITVLKEQFRFISQQGLTNEAEIIQTMFEECFSLHFYSKLVVQQYLEMLIAAMNALWDHPVFDKLSPESTPESSFIIAKKIGALPLSARIQIESACVEKWIILFSRNDKFTCNLILPESQKECYASDDFWEIDKVNSTQGPVLLKSVFEEENFYMHVFFLDYLASANTNVCKLLHVNAETKSYTFPFYSKFSPENIQALPLLFQVRICLCIIETVLMIHSKGIAHKNIKPHDIYLDGDFIPILADFSFSKSIHNCSNSDTLVGTLKYMHPSLLNHLISHTNLVDIDVRFADYYAVAITLLDIAENGKQKFNFDLSSLLTTVGNALQQQSIQQKSLDIKPLLSNLYSFHTNLITFLHKYLPFVGNVEIDLLSMQPLDRIFELRKSNYSLLSITKLQIPNMNLSIQELEVIFDCVTGVTKFIQEIDLSMNQISDKFMEIIANIVRNNTLLRTINLSGNQLTNKGIKILAPSLLNLHKLEHINLSCNKIGDDGVEALCQNLALLPALATISISRNRLTEYGVIHLKQLLASCNSLKTIYLVNNNTQCNILVK